MHWQGTKVRSPFLVGAFMIEAKMIEASVSDNVLKRHNQCS
jgi:hypothetical protein